MTTVTARSRFLRPAIFGAFDGLTVVLGVLFSLTGHPSLVLPTAVGVAVAEGVGMAAGEWLSDSDSGFAASLVIGVATIVGSIAPALPYAWLPPGPALIASVTVVAVLGAVITGMRSRARGWTRAVLETYGVLAVTILAVAAIEYLTPGGAS
jgi:VIT1/CCC1 family predicted Fe2+/Mn2+ transporter